jgi:hypothetical protein
VVMVVEMDGWILESTLLTNGMRDARRGDAEYTPRPLILGARVGR